MRARRGIDRRTLLHAAGAACALAPLLALGGCSRTSSESAATTPAATDGSASSKAPAAPRAGGPPADARTLELIAAMVGFEVQVASGAPDPTRALHVVFDPSCPHCGALWNAARTLRPAIRMRWYPVPFMGPESMARGATLLGAPDPVAAMDTHERLLAASVASGADRRPGGITVEPGALELHRKAMQGNLALAIDLGLDTVPFSFLEAGDRRYASAPGAMTAAQLSRFLDS